MGVSPLFARLGCAPPVLLSARGGVVQVTRRHGAGSSTLSIGRTALAGVTAHRRCAATRSCGARGRCPLVPLLLLWSTCVRVRVCRCLHIHSGCAAPRHIRCMAGGARVASVCFRRRSPPLTPKAERTPPTRSGATVGEPRPSARTKRGEARFPGGEGVTAKAVTDRGSLAWSASRRTRCAP